MNEFRRQFFAKIACAAAGVLASIFANPSEAAAAPSRYWRSHRCPSCGTLRLEIYAFRPDGMHYHRCGRTFWYH